MSRRWRFFLTGSLLCVALAAAAVVATYSRAPGAPLRTEEALARDARAAAAAAVHSESVAAAASSAPAEEPYEVTMSPCGTVRFERVPQRVVTQDANYNDMLVAVGEGKKLLATGSLTNFFDELYGQAGVDPGYDRSTLQSLGGGGQGTGVGGFDKERLYALHADVHHIDPLQLAGGRNWTKEDIDEISRNVGPFFANRYSREGSYGGPEPYEFYGLWELADKVARVYRRPERIARLKAIGDSLTARIQAKLPPVSQRPTVGLIYYGGGGSGRFTCYSMGNGGFAQAQYAAIGCRDAFEGKGLQVYGSNGGRGQALDLEGLLSIDPDVLIMPLAVYGRPGPHQPTVAGARASYEQLLELKKDPLAQRLKAFQHDQVLPGGSPLQGPVFYIFQLEMAAKQVYPAIFGKYRDDQAYPPDEQLFDRRAVADALAGTP